MIAERFNTFWKAYPKKVGKGAAEKAFKKIKPSGDLLQSMLKAIEDQKHSDQWKRESGKFVPYPSKWLNERRWEDDASGGTQPQNKSVDEWFNELGLNTNTER